MSLLTNQMSRWRGKPFFRGTKIDFLNKVSKIDRDRELDIHRGKGKGLGRIDLDLKEEMLAVF
jgi:hypothetical protein